MIAMNRCLLDYACERRKAFLISRDTLLRSPLGENNGDETKETSCKSTDDVLGRGGRGRGRGRSCGASLRTGGG